MKLGICFAGGGIKGAAHIGALKAFEEENIEFDYISGTSSGSIVATLYAIGYKSDEIYNIFKKYINKVNYIETKNIMKLILGLLIKRKVIIKGLNSGKIIEKLVYKECNKKGIKNISQINKKLLIPSVDMCDGKIYVFSSIKNREVYSDKIIYEDDIEIGKAVRASCSYPGVFSPMEYKKTYLIDGGIRENVPWKELKLCGVDKVISIVFENEIKKKQEVNIIDVITKSIDILCHELSTYELEGADNLIKIKTKDIHLLDKNKIDYLYNLGYIEAKGKIKNILNK
ncbi:MAG: hypothetical protein HFJ41_03540 [Clostridia bacterium]|nr:hypothetical protein [Clostridia bacterium]